MTSPFVRQQLAKVLLGVKLRAEPETTSGTRILTRGIESFGRSYESIAHHH